MIMSLVKKESSSSSPSTKTANPVASHFLNPWDPVVVHSLVWLLDPYSIKWLCYNSWPLNVPNLLWIKVTICFWDVTRESNNFFCCWSCWELPFFPFLDLSDQIPLWYYSPRPSINTVGETFAIFKKKTQFKCQQRLSSTSLRHL